MTEADDKTSIEWKDYLVHDENTRKSVKIVSLKDAVLLEFNVNY